MLLTRTGLVVTSQRFGKMDGTVAGEGVEVARSAVHQLITVLCLSVLAVIVAVPRLLLNTMLVFAVCLLPASALCAGTCFVLITVILTARVVLSLPQPLIFGPKSPLSDGKPRLMGYESHDLHSGFVLAKDLILELLRWLRDIVYYLTILERMICSLTAGKHFRQYLYSGNLLVIKNFVAFIDERVLYDILLGGMLGASAGAMMSVLCVESGYRTVVLPIISELVHLQHGLHKIKTGKLVHSHSKIHSAIVGGLVSTSLAVQLTDTCSQALSGGFCDATKLHVLGVFCVALIWKATRRDLIYGVYGAATVVVVQVLEDAIQVKDIQVILISTLVCAGIGALRIVKEFHLKGGKHFYVLCIVSSSRCPNSSYTCRTTEISWN